MRNVCRFTVTASRDLEDIIDYVAEMRGFDAADNLLDLLNQKCRMLADYPGMGRLREELAAGIRSFPAKDYLIFYRQIESGIEIVRVLSGYRDLEAFFAEP